MVGKIGQFKIQQMAFMIIAVFFFFILVGIFFVSWQFKDVNNDFARLQRDQAISSLSVISNLPEFNCDSRTSLCVDEDKLLIMSGNLSQSYSNFWPVSSIRIYKIYPKFEEEILCPGLGCNYYEIYDNGQTNTKEYSSYVSICKRIREDGYVYDKCEMGKMLVGVKINE